MPTPMTNVRWLMPGTIIERVSDSGSRVLASVARILATTDDEDVLYPRVLDAIGVALRWDAGALWTPTGDRLICADAWSAEGFDAGGFLEVTRSRSFAAGEGLPGRVWETRAPAWIVDTARDPNFPRAVAVADAGLRSGFCFPVGSPRGVLGAIEFFTAKLREPDDEMLSTMEIVGGQLGQFVERRRAEIDLRASVERKRAILDAALDCLITIDHEGRVLEFNPAAERTFGYGAEEAIGRELAELIVPPSLRDRHREGFERYLRTGEPHVLGRRIEITGMRADGSEFPVELTITRIGLSGPPMFSGSLRDITARQRGVAELRASRARILEAADTARRRLERDLHDGAQQRLVGLALTLRLAADALETDEAGARRLLGQASEELAAAIGELREFARGIHPQILSDGGLAPALAALARRFPLPVDVDEIPRVRLGTAVESTAYFFVAEALTNVTRYAEATSARVWVSLQDGHLAIEVADDGRGGADPAQGSGLRGLSDRVAALSGELELDSPPGQGTTVRARIPVTGG